MKRQDETHFTVPTDVVKYFTNTLLHKLSKLSHSFQISPEQTIKLFSPVLFSHCLAQKLNIDEESIDATSPPKISRAISSTFERLTQLVYLESAKTGNLCFINNNNDLRDEFKQIFTLADLFHYIFAGLHCTPPSPLPIDIRYPADTDSFWYVSNLGEKLFNALLWDDSVLTKSLEMFPLNGEIVTSNIISQTKWVQKPQQSAGVTGQIWINEHLFFDNVPLSVWQFSSSKYSPAKDWLRQHQNQLLSVQKLSEYQTLLYVLTSTTHSTNKIKNKLI